MTVFKSTNPFNLNVFQTYKGHSLPQIDEMLEQSEKTFSEWRSTSLAHRTKLIARAAEELRANSEEYATMMTREMGKPITESFAEIEKCAWVCEYYAQNAEDFLADKTIETDATHSFVRYNPIGCVLAIMPWNFPFWQAFRFAAPTLTAGNVAILKHAANVPGCANLIEQVFLRAGYPKAVFQNTFANHDAVEHILSHPFVKAVSLTGSDKAGAKVAAIAGSKIKKSLLELGGSNAFVVLADADLEQTIPLAVKARMINTGQSCIASKRFIVVSDVYEPFVEGFIKETAALKSGDPIDESTQVGPLARVDLAEKLQKQVEESIAQGAKLSHGGKRHNAFYEPTILENVHPGMPAFDEETFGPVAAITRAANADEAFELAQKTKFGLGITVCTTDLGKALQYADRVKDGAFFVNELVKSDPRLPFGGEGISGYGRELSKEGILAFVNQKTVYVK